MPAFPPVFCENSVAPCTFSDFSTQRANRCMLSNFSAKNASSCEFYSFRSKKYILVRVLHCYNPLNVIIFGLTEFSPKLFSWCLHERSSTVDIKIKERAVALLSVHETAAYLGCSPKSLHNRRYRQNLGLQTIRLGRRLKFDQRDLDVLIERLKVKERRPRWLASPHAQVKQ